MKRNISILIITLVSLTVGAQVTVSRVATFKGIQVTGVTVSNKGRVFANFPRWRTGIPFSVVEVMADGSYKPYPNQEWNNWEIGQPVNKNKFIAVQSVVAHKDKLYVLDTANPQSQGIITQPKVYVFDLKTNQLLKKYTFPATVVKPKSYVNDLRVDDKKNKIYFTDSYEAALIILDTKTEKCMRVLDNHPFTRAETDHLTFGTKVWKNRVNSDGIELDTKNDILYFHALTGYTLYGIKTADLLNPEKLKTVKPFHIKTSATDGMIMDAKGNLYFADLENNKIQYLTADRKEIKTLLEGETVRWADTFSIYGGYLYYSNSRIHETGADISQMEFTINKVKLPE